MGAKDDLIVYGAIGGIVIIGLSVGGVGIKSWLDKMRLEKTVSNLQDKIVTVKETRHVQYTGLQEFYDESVDKINELNQKIGDLTNELNEVGKNTKMTVADNLAGIGIEEMIKKAQDAGKTLAQQIPALSLRGEH